MSRKGDDASCRYGQGGVKNVQKKARLLNKKRTQLFGAHERNRTSTAVRPYAPQAHASTSSAT